MADNEEVVRYSFEGTVESLQKATGKAIDLLDKFENKVNKVSEFDPGKSIKNVAKAFGVAKIAEALGKAVTNSVSFVENLNLFNVAMGESVAEATKFVNQMSEVYGMDASNLYRTAGYFYQLTDAIGMADEQSRILSLSLTKASNDIASLFNVEVQRVVDNLASGMQGMSRAVRKYGMDIRSVALQETALTYGLTQQIEKMSETNRMALRYLTMMQQVRNALKQTTQQADGTTQVLGDFARNIETPANQLRVLQEQISQVGRAIGTFFIPALSKLLPILNGFAMALREVLTFLATLLGISNLSFGGASSGIADEASAVVALGDAADKTAKKMKNMIAPFDELNILSDKSGSSSGGGSGADYGQLDPRLAEAISEMSLELDDIRMKAHAVRDSLLEFFGFDYVSIFNPDTGEFERQLQWFSDKFESNLIDKLPQWKKTISALFENFPGIVEGVRSVFSSLKSVLEEIVRILTEQLSEALGGLTVDEAFAQFISKLPERLEKAASWIAENKTQLAQLSIAIAAVFAGIQLIAGLKLLSRLAVFVKGCGAVLSAVAKVVAIFSSLSSGVLLVTGLITAAIAVLVTLWHTSDSFRDSVLNAVSAIVAVLQSFWNGVFKPVLDSVVALVKLVWSEISPIIVNVLGIIEVLGSTLLQGLGTSLRMVADFVTNVFGPTFMAVFDTVMDIVGYVVEVVSRLINSLITVLRGLIEFLVGVFTLDWQKAWEGIKRVFGGIFNGIITIVESVLNFLITGMNTFIGGIVNSLSSALRGVLSKFEPMLAKVGISINVGAFENIPKISRLQLPRVPLASGGVVTGPTNALIGEGHYDEAVIPLGNSPQMRDFANSIADRISGEEQVRLLREQNVLLRQILEKTGLSIDGQKLTEYVTHYQRVEARAYGV